MDFTEDIAAVSHIEIVPKILEVVCRSTGMGFSAVARVTEERWIACAVRDEIAFGLKPGGELDVRTTICDEIRDSNQLVAIDEVSSDPNFCQHPTPKMYGFQSYISVPLRYPDGRFFGTLCAIDPKPARVSTPEVVGMFTLFADLIGFHLETHERLHASETELTEQRRDGQLRDQFIAVLGHDLRNPLAAIRTSANVLAGVPMPDAGNRVVSIIQRSSARMAGLVENLMDFAQGKLGGGLRIEKEPVDDLAAAIEHVVAELSSGSPNRRIETHVALTMPVECDRARISQLLSNLVSNAMTHGYADGLVVVRARTEAGDFVLSVENTGDEIPEARIQQLFHPFARAGARGSEGLGLGLYIASEIARAHGGTLTVSSTPELTRFTLRMPASRPAA